MDGVLGDLLVYYIQLLAIMNPFSALPTFMSLTESFSESSRRYVVKKAFMTMIVLVTLFTLLGTYILMVFSISIDSLRIGGGILLLVIALDMLGGLPRTKTIDPSDVAVVPIATPLIVGPGTITTIILLTSKNSSPTNVLLVYIAAIAAVVTTYIVLYYSRKLMMYLRPSLLRAIGRFMSLIIASIAVEMIFLGIKGYIHQIIE